MPRHLIAVEKSAATQFTKKTAGVRAQSVICQAACPSTAGDGTTIRIARKRSHAFPMLSKVMEIRVRIAATQRRLAAELKIRIAADAIITALNSAEPKNDISQSFRA